MKQIDRCAITILPKEPFVEWLNEIFPEEQITLNDLLEEGFQTYLLPTFEDQVDDAVLTYFEEICPGLFKAELKSWQIEKDKWPKQMDSELFNKWFSIDFSDVVYDTVS